MKLLTLILTKPKMDKQTNKRKEYITNPARIVSFIVFVFWLGVAYSTIINRIQKLEDFQKSVDMVKIESTLTAMQKDIEWIRMNLNIKK